ncbi:MAG: 3'-5' exonuclease [Thermoanaerobaculia bacterium]|nr:3'-5' exonuclease [Thermoanaerobaculia bacterium]
MGDPIPRPDAAGVLTRRIGETPIVVFAVETTGFPAGRHRICEISLCRLGAGGRTELLFDSLIDPGRPVTGREIHGISDRDVADAPRFAEVAGRILEAMRGCVLASYNVTYGMQFLRDELERVDVALEAPHFCLMFLRPMLALGPRCSLEEACTAHGVPYSRARCSRAAAEAATDLLRYLLGAMAEREIVDFADLAELGDFPFLDSLGRPPVDVDPARIGVPQAPVRRRVVRSLAGRGGGEDSVRRYWQAVSAAAADGEISEVELGLVRKMRELLDLSDEQARAVHARAFMAAILDLAGDDWLTDDEAARLRGLLRGLSSLGWAPGD